MNKEFEIPKVNVKLLKLSLPNVTGKYFLGEMVDVTGAIQALENSLEATQVDNITTFKLSESGSTSIADDGTYSYYGVNYGTVTYDTLPTGADDYEAEDICTDKEIFKVTAKYQANAGETQNIT